MRFVAIQEFMVDDLHLKGNELITYAVIYGFSQDGYSVFKGSSKYIAKWCGVSKRSALDILAKLVEKGLIEKHVRDDCGVRLVDYSVVPVKKLHQGGEETSPGVVKKLHQGGEETSPHNIEDNIKENITYKEKEKEKEKKGQVVEKFRKPTVEQVNRYCEERKNGIDAQSFCDFYEARGWMVGKSPMKNWQAAVRTWEHRRREENSNIVDLRPLFAREGASSIKADKVIKSENKTAPTSPENARANFEKYQQLKNNLMEDWQ